MDRSHPAQATPSTLAGKVLLAGAGFIVTSTVWFLLSFAQAVHGTSILTTLDLVLAVGHLALGGVIFARIRLAVYIGGAVAVVALVLGVVNAVALSALPTIILPAIADGVSLLLLIVSRGDMRGADPSRIS
ncbi:MAG TPA: hypothetical protein VFN57_06355 [Thermomicrobiaceae bacterium]|nr:hypothetical protein [Thermomicrobiaceae bacterium]